MASAQIRDQVGEHLITPQIVEIVLTERLLKE
jgi:hypothetical protein